MEPLKVVNLSNQKVGDFTPDEAVFGYPLKRHLIYEAVNAYRAAGRAGTRQTKTRAEVSGSGRKLWKQKKTGRARVGSIRSSIWRHGGTVFGPHPHDYENTLPRRMRKNAIRSVLSSKLRGEKVQIIENLELDSPKTKEMAKLLGTLKITGKVLFVDREVGRNLELAARNLKHIGVAQASHLSVVDLLHYDTLVFTRSAAESLVEIYAS